MTMSIVKRAAIALAAVSVLVGGAAPADSAGYSDNHRVAAHIVRGQCYGLFTGYDLTLKNQMPKLRRFHVVTRSRGVKFSEQRVTVPGRSRVGVNMRAPSARSLTVTVRFRGEVLVHRHLNGICRY